MMHPWRPAIIAGVIAVLGTGTTPAAPAKDKARQNYAIVVHADSAQSLADEKEVRDAVMAMRNGNVQEAIDGPLTDVVNRYEKAYGNSKDAVFSARSPAQGMMYMTFEATKYIAGAGNGSGKAIDVGPAWAKAYWARGYGYSELKRFPEAEAELTKAIKLSPQDAQFVDELAYVYQMEHRFADSLALFQKVPEFVDTMDDWDDATKKDFRCTAFRGQGYDLVELHQLDEAEKAYQSCIALIPGEPKSLGELGYIKGLRAKEAKP
jgi:tetratricopeptide (TPR) repeat protein